ncbi:MAG: hypothetical protein FWC11_02670 [Firmicutes bacterium]|nr:hypothetical protein [Bacillota bacterium]MCL2255742.1 hypothetical protein [Bacillota bacterium]
MLKQVEQTLKQVNNVLRKSSKTIRIEERNALIRYVEERNPQSHYRRAN